MILYKLYYYTIDFKFHKYYIYGPLIMALEHFLNSDELELNQDS